MDISEKGKKLRTYFLAFLREICYNIQNTQEEGAFLV